MARVKKTTALNTRNLFKIAEGFDNPAKVKRRITERGLFAQLPISSSEVYQLDDHTKFVIMWRWVLDRALLDLIGGGRKKHYDEAYKWVFNNHSDFKVVCHYAEIKPELVQEVIDKFHANYMNKTSQLRKTKISPPTL